MERLRELILLKSLRRSGCLKLLSHATRRGLRVLCYHGISLRDEHLFRPTLFMRPDTFRRRLEVLRAKSIPVVPLPDAVSGGYPDGAVVLTLDDGWEGTEIAAEILAEFGFPATLYSSTYYSTTGTQVFNVAAAYVLWKTDRSRIVLPAYGVAGTPGDPVLGATLDALDNELAAHERQRLLEDLQQLAQTSALPDGFPSGAAVLIVEANDDLIVHEASRAQLREALPDAAVWSLSGAGHALLLPDLPARVISWIGDAET